MLSMTLRLPILLFSMELQWPDAGKGSSLHSTIPMRADDYLFRGCFAQTTSSLIGPTRCTMVADGPAGAALSRWTHIASFLPQTGFHNYSLRDA